MFSQYRVIEHLLQYMFRKFLCRHLRGVGLVYFHLVKNNLRYLVCRVSEPKPKWYLILFVFMRNTFGIMSLDLLLIASDSYQDNVEQNLPPTFTCCWNNFSPFSRFESNLISVQSSLKSKERLLFHTRFLCKVTAEGIECAWPLIRWDHIQRREGEWCSSSQHIPIDIDMKCLRQV